jgi:hypothetical protein
VSRRGLYRRVGAIHDRLNPRPDPTFLAYARAVIEFGGGQPTLNSVLGLARYLSQPYPVADASRTGERQAEKTCS